MTGTCDDLAYAHKRDLLLACIHEYAHMIVARHLGIHGFVKIARNGSGGELERHFGGTFTRFADGNTHQKRMIGLAGTVAEHVYCDPAIEAFQIADFLECGADELSISDADISGDYTAADIEECLVLVKLLWATILEGAKLEADLQTELLMPA